MQNQERSHRGRYHHGNANRLEADHFTGQQIQPSQAYGLRNENEYPLQQTPRAQKEFDSETVPLRESYQPRDQANRSYKPLSRRCRCDYAATILCLLLYVMLVLSVGSFIYFSKAKQNAEGWVDGKTVADAFAYALGFAALAATLNEALIDRCWRRVRSQALRGSVTGAHLRAANFQLLDVLRRIVKRKITKRELATLLSYVLLRWGTLLAFSSIQLTVHYRRNPDNPSLFLTQMQTVWVPVPLVVHIACTVGALALCQLPPWALLLNTYDEKVVHAAYRRYLDLVPSGSAATSEQVAELLDKTSVQPRDFLSLAIEHNPGLQIGKKLRGTVTGALIIIVVPALVYAAQILADKEGLAVTRFAYSLGLSATAAGYTLSQNYAIWTLGLEGITSTPRSDTNFLGTTSGIMLLAKAMRQRRPARVFLMYWVFWLHSLTFRFMVFTYTWVLSVQKIVPELFAETYSAYDRLSRFFWPAMVWGVILLPFVIWICTPFKAPLAPFDGWRHAKILDGATKGKGRYGIAGPPGRGSAAWGLTTRAFRRETLL